MSTVDVRFAGEPVTVTIDREIVVELPPRVFRVRLVGMLFETDKVFLLPKAMHGIRGLRRYYEEHPRLSVLVTGHTDTVGSAAYNEHLSDERAAAVAAYLSEDVDAWLRHYSGTPHSSRWGSSEDQHMLSALPDDDNPHYTGPITGFRDSATADAIRRFQASAGLVEDGIAGPNTRRALITQYMALDGTTLPAEATLLTHGCGEHHLRVPTPDGADEPSNRRVEIFLFEGPVEPPPQAACGGCAEYPQWLARTVETIDFATDPGWLDVAVTDDVGSLLSEAAVRISGAVAAQQHTPDHGVARFLDLPAGNYEVAVVADGFSDAVFAVTVVPGDAPAEFASPGPIELASADDDQSSLVQDDGAPAASGGGKSSGGGQTGVNSATASLSPTVTQLILIEYPDKASAPPPALTDAAREGVERKGGIPGGATTALPNAMPWENVGVRVDSVKGPLHFAVDSDTGGDPLDGETTIHSAAGRPVTVLGKGPHKGLVHWHASSAAPLGSVDGIQKAQLTGRLRFSLWADPNNITDANLSRGSDRASDIIDDLSLLITVQSNTDATLMPTWDVGLAPGQLRSEAQVKKFYADIIERCHKHGIQVFAGFGLVDRGESRIVRFDEWLNDLTKEADGGKAEATRFATELVSFIDKNTPGCDGISFDIESCGLFKGSPLAAVNKSPKTHAALIVKLRAALRFFYHAVADILAKTNRICAITVGGMMSDVAAVTKLPSVPNTNPNALLAARLHTYDIPIGKPNIIIRPMAYDNAGGVGASAKIPAFNSDPGQFEWHEGIIKFALENKRVHPHQFQLGVKDFQPKTNGVPSGQGGNVPSPGRIRKRCTDLLRPNRVGLCLFALFSPPSTKSLGEPWKHNASYNKALNLLPDGSVIGRPSIGQPLQVPLDDTRLAVLKKP